jgi:hypothetical protein
MLMDAWDTLYITCSMYNALVALHDEMSPAKSGKCGCSPTFGHLFPTEEVRRSDNSAIT